MASDLTPETIELSVDLKRQALHHIDFLARVDSVPELKQTPVLRYALFRYERYWLPLAAEYRNECLSAPLDIEWIWHCHMLSPVAYGKDCMTITGMVVDHKLRSPREYDEALEKSRLYWHQKYGDSDDIPFQVNHQALTDASAAYKQHLHPSVPDDEHHLRPSVPGDKQQIHPSVPHDKQQMHPSVPEDFESQLTYDVIDGAGRQKVFYYQVALPHYRDSEFLGRSLLRYRQFLFLKTKYPKSFSVPCFDMDLMWHTHQVNPLLYIKDTTNLLGHVFNHDDSTNDRSEGSRQYVGQQKTTTHWSELYNDHYTAAGAMYRGPPSEGVLHHLSEQETNIASTKTAQVKLTGLKLIMSDGVNINDYRDVRVQCHGCAGNRKVTKWFTLKTKKSTKQESDKYVMFDVNGETLTFDTRNMNSVKLDVETNTGKFACINRPKETIGDAVYDFLSKIEGRGNNNNGTFQSTQRMDDGVSVCLQCKFAAPVRGSTLLFLQTGTTEDAVIPHNVLELLGPVNMEQLHNGADNHCQITTIRMKNHMGREDFTSKVVFSHQLGLNVIQIFYHGHMTALAHLIGHDQLPTQQQVKKGVLTLDFHGGERAVLIKNHAGDWGVLKAAWSPGDKAANGRTDKETRFEPGRMSLYLYKMSTGTCETATLDPSRGSLRLDGTRVDLQKGVIEVGPGSLEVGERIALAFCVSLLQRILVPKRQA